MGVISNKMGNLSIKKNVDICIDIRYNININIGKVLMKEVTRYKNEMNTLSIGKWTAEEMNFLFAILTQVRDEGCKELKFDTYDLREYVKFDLKNLNGGIIQ